MNSSLPPLGMDCRIWNGVEIQRRPSDGYVNATAMCKANGKLWKNYHQNERTQAYIAALKRALGSAGFPADLIQTITTGLNHLRGTWIHPRLAVDLARWISPSFAVWMDGWFLEAAAGQVSQVRDTQPVAQPIARPEPTTVLTAPAHWCRLVDHYVDDVDAGLADVPFAQRRRSLRFARPLATHFMQWLIDHHAQLVIPAAAPTPKQPAPAAMPSMGLVSSALAEPTLPQPIVIHESRHSSIRPGDVLTGPEVARLFGLSANAINHWARHQSVGAVRNGWRLIGRGKRACGQLGGLIPPGSPSWLFQKM